MLLKNFTHTDPKNREIALKRARIAIPDLPDDTPIDDALAERIVEALRAQGIYVAYNNFDDEARANGWACNCHVGYFIKAPEGRGEFLGGAMSHKHRIDAVLTNIECIQRHRDRAAEEAG